MKGINDMHYYGINFNDFVDSIYSTTVAKQIKHLLFEVLASDKELTKQIDNANQYFDAHDMDVNVKTAKINDQIILLIDKPFDTVDTNDEQVEAATKVLQLTIFNIAWYAYLQQYGDENIANNDHTKLTEKEDRYLAALTNVLHVNFDQLKLVKIYNFK